MAFYSLISRQIARYQGEFIVGAKVTFFDAGTNTPRTMYQDGDLNTPFDPDNIASDANAQFPNIWGQGNPYKAIIKTPGGALIDTIDNIPGDVAAGGGGGGGDIAVATGIGGWTWGTAAPSGWVRLNGRTIGSAASGATERANDDTEALFLFLWAADTTLAVSGGRGASAAADWAANKTIALPDGRARALFGRDAMGNSAAGRFAGVTFGSGTSDALGASGGAALHTLTTAELASHTHTGTTGSSGSHAHTGTTAADGLHAHTGSTLSDGAHVHGYLFANALSIGGTNGGSTFAPPNAATTTDSSGAHTHVLSINQGGSHTHSFGTNTTGDHSHNFTSNASGSGDAHNNMPPFLLVTWLIKL